MTKIEVDSSFIHAIEYDEEMQWLEVEMRFGGTYLYRCVPKNVFEGLMESSSKGQYFNRYIRNEYVFTQLR